MKYLTFIVTLSSFLVASVLLVIALASCAPNADAEIQAEWIHIDGTEAMGRVTVLETDGRLFYAGTSDGVYISLDNGYTWRLTLDVNDCTAITVHQNTVYAGTYYEGVFRSDSHGNTWKPINNGIRTINVDNGEIRLPYIEQILVTSSGTVVAVGYHSGTHTSSDRGETWHDITLEWKVRQREAPDLILGDSIWSMTEFDGYLWAAFSTSLAFRSLDHGETWECLARFEAGRVNDWAAFYNRLYVAGEKGIGRWNDKTQMWEYLMDGFPTSRAFIRSLAVNRGRLYAGLGGWGTTGVYVFDARGETWYSVGLDEFRIFALLSHQSYLYAATVYDDGTRVQRKSAGGIYRATIPRVRSQRRERTYHHC